MKEESKFGLQLDQGQQRDAAADAGRQLLPIIHQTDDLHPSLSASLSHKTSIDKIKFHHKKS